MNFYETKKLHHNDGSRKNLSPFRKTFNPNERLNFEYFDIRDKKERIEEKIKLRKQKSKRLQEEKWKEIQTKFKRQKKPQKHLKTLSSFAKFSNGSIGTSYPQQPQTRESTAYKLVRPKLNPEMESLEGKKIQNSIDSYYQKEQKIFKSASQQALLDKFKIRAKSPTRLITSRAQTYYIYGAANSLDKVNSPFYQHIKINLEYSKYFEEVKLMKFYSRQLVKKQLNLSLSSYYKGKKTIIFDLDETLIHCDPMAHEKYDEKVYFKNINNVEVGFVSIRPYAKEMLKRLSEKFQLIVFTASQQIYADQVIKLLDPKNELFQHRLYRKDCINVKQKTYVKDLRIINRNLEDMVLVDNAAYSYELQIDNGVPIIPYYKGDKDNELRGLEIYLQSLAYLKDVREKNRRTFQLGRYKEFENASELISKLYSHRI